MVILEFSTNETSETPFEECVEHHHEPFLGLRPSFSIDQVRSRYLEEKAVKRWFRLWWFCFLCRATSQSLTCDQKAREKHIFFFSYLGNQSEKVPWHNFVFVFFFFFFDVTVTELINGFNEHPMLQSSTGHQIVLGAIRKVSFPVGERTRRWVFPPDRLLSRLFSRARSASEWGVRRADSSRLPVSISKALNNQYLISRMKVESR